MIDLKHIQSRLNGVYLTESMPHVGETGSENYIRGVFSMCRKDLQDAVTEITTLLEKLKQGEPSDGQEPVTVKWLKSVGFKREMQVGDSNHLALRQEGIDLTRWEDKLGNEIRHRWSLNGGWIPSFDPKTKGDVRQLVEALGRKLL